jgi:hypothetical protein
VNFGRLYREKKIRPEEEKFAQNGKISPNLVTLAANRLGPV